ncbi:DUF4179 domain-containing protein [Paenibacillus tritici]|uniref:DUF4179 domain-containing protein n=1 Tax=Paenibacillus tritici TaxID=1873425 RepID=UPI001BA8B6E1|nr:DUF4179 domain-containing protein [Paenibacillus tritici]QUL57383.1 DUF4179 domain-containing protein [Paenibacillus tritici]
MVRTEEELLKEYYQSLSAEAEEIAEMKLNTAIRSGLTRSARTARPLRNRYVLATAAVMALVLLFVLPWESEALKPRGAALSAQVPALNSEWLGDYSNIAGSDSTVISAFEAGLIKRLSGATAEKDGYVLTVDGFAADRMGIILLYTLENKNEQALDYTFSVTDNKDRVLGQGRMSGGEQNTRKTRINRGYRIMQWNTNYTKLPEQIMLKASVFAAEPAGEIEEGVLHYETVTEISVPVALDLNAVANAGETLAVNKTLTMAGQRITIGDAYLAASGMYVETEFSSQNSIDIFRLASPHILIGSGNDFTALYSKASLDVEGKRYLLFPGNGLSQSTMKIQIDGIIGLEKSAQELVIDTDKRKIIKGADKRLRITAASTPNSLILEYQRQGNYSAANTVNVILDQTFKDGAGKLHTAVYNSSVPVIDPGHANDKVPPFQFAYKLGTAELQQPLTFKVISYPNLIKDSAELILRK